MDPVGIQSRYGTCRPLSWYIAFNMALLTHRAAHDRHGCLEEQQGYDVTILKRHQENASRVPAEAGL